MCDNLGTQHILEKQSNRFVRKVLTDTILSFLHLPKKQLSFLMKPHRQAYICCNNVSLVLWFLLYSTLLNKVGLFPLYSPWLLSFPWVEGSIVSILILQINQWRHLTTYSSIISKNHGSLFQHGQHMAVHLSLLHLLHLFKMANCFLFPIG